MEFIKKLRKKITFEKLLSFYATMVFVQFLIEFVPITIFNIPRVKVYVSLTIFFIVAYFLIGIFKLVIFIKNKIRRKTFAYRSNNYLSHKAS